MNHNLKTAAHWARVGYLPLLVMANVCVVLWGALKLVASYFFASEAPLCDYDTLVTAHAGIYQAMIPIVGNAAVALRASELGVPDVLTEGLFPGALAVLLFAHALASEGFVKFIEGVIAGVSLAITLGTFVMDLDRATDQHKVSLAAFDQRAMLQEMRPTTTQLALQHPMPGQPESVRACGIALQLVHARYARMCSFEQPLRACWSSQAHGDASAEALYSETRTHLLDPSRR